MSKRQRDETTKGWPLPLPLQIQLQDTDTTRVCAIQRFANSDLGPRSQRACTRLPVTAKPGYRQVFSIVEDCSYRRSLLSDTLNTHVKLVQIRLPARLLLPR